jgi:hypothetical protein
LVILYFYVSSFFFLVYSCYKMFCLCFVLFFEIVCNGMCVFIEIHNKLIIDDLSILMMSFHQMLIKKKLLNCM